MLTGREIQTLIENAFKLPRLASRHEGIIGGFILKSIDGSKFADKPPLSTKKTNKRSSKVQLCQNLFDAFGSKPLSRSDISKLLPNFTPNDVRDALVHLLESKQISRIVVGGHIKYTKC